MKKHFSVITSLIISSSAVFAENIQNEPYFREYKDIKSELLSEDIFKTQKRNLAIDWARDQCNQNDTNIGAISCLSDLSQDIQKQIDLKVTELKSPIFNKSHVKWTAYVEAQCNSVIGEFTGSIGPKLHANCLITLYKEYLNVLDDLY
ncbi:hypothetical protein RFI02_16290 [Acinetobacter sichuanensis]|uniref:lysozyme inhibitor LprI family protein n=1 Tax=Acinetobacter sichuanensis TaxID=2136183 RepID=UPI00280D639B|nr:lysozyme inhibitor LprI family protein [Acinetobacter sichuanensis]MDQ9022672.1 hypothetical protein [Acinetobacter sichuanensis]